tara:strand:+ start:5353 stop:7098 length:1746 start_codon:yes stop_codon:yes gene_type:complete
MALNFPNSPSNGDTHNAANGLTYSYDGTKWVTQGSYTTGAIQAQKLTDISSSFNGSTATFNLTSGSDTVKPHNDNSVLIVVNGTIQEPTTAYTIDSSAGTITFTSGNIPTAGQSFFGIVNSRLPTSSADSLALTGGTMTGSITFAAGQVIPVDKIQDSNTTQEGVVQLEDSTTSISTNKAATPNSIKVTKDVADAALPKAGGTMTGNITFNSGQAFDASKITSGTLPGARLGADVDTTKMTAATVVIDSEQASHTANDTSFYTSKAADSRFFVTSSAETIKDGDTFPDNDTTIATTAAINDRIVDLVDDVGGFVPIANETSFPSANPDVNDSTGTIVSVKALTSAITTGSGATTHTINNGAGSGNNVTITGLTESTTYPAGMGMLLETSATSGNGSSSPPRAYTFHRLVPKATEVTTVASNNTNINTVATNISNVNSAATNISNINAVGNNASNINAVAGQITFAEDLGLITESLTTESGNNINTVATNINNINSFSDTYKVLSSAPSSGVSEGDLWYDSTNNILKYYTGSAWASITAGIANLVEDQTPELYAALDCNDKNLTEVATISGNNLQIDFGSIA